jgi:lysophospholipase L1-like esterase
MNILITFVWTILLAISSLLTPQPRFIPLGDSVTHRGTEWVAVSAQDNLQLVRNAGVDYQTTAQMLARLDRDVLSYGPDVVTVEGGTNDRANRVPLRTAIANLRQMVVRIQATGARVVLLTIPPNTGSVAPWNAAIRALAASEGCGFADTFAVLANSRGHWLPGLTADGIHPNAAGYALMEPVIAAALMSVMQ